MTISLTQLLDGTIPENDYDLAVLSDKIWEIGDLESIKAEVDPDTFHLFITINVIGNWEGDGWGCLIGDHPELNPYIAPALEYMGFSQVYRAFQRAIAVFPEFTAFKNDNAYCDVINFLQNTRFKVADERLNRYSTEERAEMSRQFRQSIDDLERITGPLWGSSKGWRFILDRITNM